MFLNKINRFLITVSVSTLILFGCDNTDGNLVLKEPRKELKDMPKGKDWLTVPITDHMSDQESSRK